MKNSLDWHRKCLSNTRDFQQREREHLEKSLALLAEAEARADFYDKQIAEADYRGMTEFDRDKFLVKRKTKVVKDGD